jgi:hypothetical protein
MPRPVVCVGSLFCTRMVSPPYPWGADSSAEDTVPGMWCSCQLSQRWFHSWGMISWNVSFNRAPLCPRSPLWRRPGPPTSWSTHVGSQSFLVIYHRGFLSHLDSLSPPLSTDLRPPVGPAMGAPLRSYQACHLMRLEWVHLTSGHSPLEPAWLWDERLRDGKRRHLGPWVLLEWSVSVGHTGGMWAPCLLLCIDLLYTTCC